MGTSSLTNLHSQQAADGLLAGNVDGLNCYGNTISNYNAGGSISVAPPSRPDLRE